MLYEYDSIKDSQAIGDTTDDYFMKLVQLIQDEHGVSKRSEFTPKSNKLHWLSASMFLQHVYNYWILIDWLKCSITRGKKISVKQGNLIVAIAMDIIIGYLILQLLSQDKKEISVLLMGILEKLINSLYSLLKWLMGAPVGLKLNNAFNKMLGKYFSYHVQLWWIFLDVSGEKLDVILHIYHYIGYLGFTFQTALISDLICIATFHSYCIYVYAARLFNIQISGLIALLRLFVGRKYNPLRGGIDSCEYTNQELFVGTVAFTILLLLLPTTALYYIVFTLFRVLSLVVQYLLAKLIYMVQTLPLYVVSLWLTSSPKVTGNILIEVINQESNSPLILRIKLLNKSIPQLVKIFQPPVEVPKQVEWTNLLSNVLVGKQIV
ncbi:phosphatidylinositol N-acetylglucosaminyltransferase subunit Q isoform X2 [Trichoplusia ni]|nr:phosphatidylinositol N-acetylglucosaminyltransferase subunit Q isoform X2 [Trichoplusia ni]